MAVGDLVVANGQYEFNGVLFNDGNVGNIQVLKCQGLFSLPPVKMQEFELQDDHGGFLGNDLLSMRRVSWDLAIRGSESVVHQKMDLIRSTFQPQGAEVLLVFQRPNIGKRQILVKVSKLDGFDSDWDMSFGLAQGNVLFVAPDPRVTAFAASTQTVVIAASGTTNSNTATNDGYFKGGAWPVLSMSGPVTNPRIANAAASNRSIKLDLVVNAGSTLVVDVKNRSVLLDGVDRSDTIRSDNQWWRLVPGANLITYTRSNNPATASTLTITWRNTYL